MERRFTKHVIMTAWRRLSLTLLVALCCHTAASAETLTVYDGTNDSQYVPVYGYGADTQGTTSEFVIPRGQLGAMKDGTISALTFYLRAIVSNAWTATFHVYLKEIDATTLTGIVGPDASTVVYTGTLNATGSGKTMTITFNKGNYTYNGGDLLIGTYVSVKSTNYPKAYFYGVSQSVTTACYKISGITTYQQFIPKTTFTYYPSGSVVPPNNLAVSDVTTTTATVSWNGNGDSYNVRYRKHFLSEGFEGGSMPTGWTTEGPGTWSVGTGDFAEITGSHSGNYNAKIADNKKGNVTYLITPSMDLSGETNLTLSFWYINRAYVNNIDGIGVYYRVANGTWTELWSTTEAHGSWTNQEVTLTGLAANYQLGFKMTNNDGYRVGLDDIQILSSADWQTVSDIATMSTTLIGLDANTTYEFQVQGVKDGLTSDWSPIATFTTAANAVVLTEGNCGTTGSESSVTWSYNTTTHTLTISGTGPMMYYGSAQGGDSQYHSTAPWSHFDSEIQKVIVEDGVTYVGSYAFAYCTALTSVSLPASVTALGDYVCYSSSVTRIDIPGTTAATIGTGGFDFCPDGLQIAVPAQLLKTYKEAENWSGYAAKMVGVLNETTGFDNTFATGNYEYTRTFKCGIASTVCLPFSVTAAQAASVGKFYTFDGIDKTGEKWEVIMKETNTVSTDLSANTPYLFMPYIFDGMSQGDAVEFTFSGTVSTAGNGDYYSWTEPGTSSYWTFQGVYYNLAWNEGNENLGKVYGFAAQSHDGGSYTVNPGDFVKAMAGASIAPFRAFLKFTPVSGAPRRGAAEEALPSRMTVRLVNADGDVTAIGTIDTKTGEIRFDSEAWYTLDGRRLNGKPAQKGVYINNGKKIIVK